MSHQALLPQVGPGSSLTAVMQDYLKIIYAAGEWSTQEITTSWIAAKQDVAPSSVSNMIGKLKALKLVDHQPYGAIKLTSAGEQVGKAMVRRHRLIETYLVAELGYGWDQVHAEAEILEHAISDFMLEQIDAKLGRPTRDPHGDPIPDPTGEVNLPLAVQLSQLPIGARGAVARLSDTDSELLRNLADLGITLDVALSVQATNTIGAGTCIQIQSPHGETNSVTLGEVALDSIWVTQCVNP